VEKPTSKRRKETYERGKGDLKVTSVNGPIKMQLIEKNGRKHGEVPRQRHCLRRSDRPLQGKLNCIFIRQSVITRGYKGRLELERAETRRMKG